MFYSKQKTPPFRSGVDHEWMVLNRFGFNGSGDETGIYTDEVDQVFLSYPWRWTILLGKPWSPSNNHPLRFRVARL